MSDGAPIEQKSPGRLFVPSLTLTMYAEADLNLLLSLFLLDIALTFGVSVGTASQIGMISSIATMIVGLLMGVLSVRYNHKLLLLAGATIITVGVVGCFLAPSFVFMEFFYPFDGVGSAMVVAMSYTLIGRVLPLEKRSRAVGWAVAASAMSFVIGSFLVFFVPGFSSWRFILVGFFLPVSIVGLFLAYFGIPSLPNKPQITFGENTYVSSLKDVFLKKSAFAFLSSWAIFNVSQVWAVYAITFYRTRFSLSIGDASVVLLIMTLSLAIGGIIGGRLINRMGRKRLAILALGLASVLLMIFVYLPFLWIVLPLDLASTWLRGAGFAAAISLGLEQAPKSRGTMMSIAPVMGALGAAIGLAVGGRVLDQFGFFTLGPVLGLFGIVSISFLYFFVKDITKQR